MKRVLKPHPYPIPQTENKNVHSGSLSVAKINAYFQRKKKTGEALSANEMIINTTPNGITGMIIRANNHGKILDIESSPSPEGERMIGKDLNQLFPREIAVVHAEQLKKVLKTRKSVDYSYHWESNDNESNYYEARAIKNNEKEVIFIIRDISENKKEKLSLVRGIIEGEEKERKRVAQELHDGLGQIISALYMQVGTLSKKPGIGEYLQGPMKMIADIITEYRAISHNLMPPILEGAGLPDVIQILCDRINATGNCKAIFRKGKFKSKPAKNVILELYRMSQELINNAIKHSGCDTIEMELNESDRDITISIKDNGKGFNISEVKKKTTGIGLKNMLTRVELLGGTLEFDSIKNKGTTVMVSILRPNAKIKRAKKKTNRAKV